MHEDPLVVFVDDSADELALFREVFGDQFNLVTARSAEEGFERLGERTPDLILLDVYIPEGDRDQEVPEELARQILNLPADQGELRQAYTNLVLAEERFRSLQNARAHGIGGGLKLARAFAGKLPDVPLIGYSRKSNTLEALIYLSQIPTCCSFVQKPHSTESWEETTALTHRESSRLLGLFQEFLDRNPAEFAEIRNAAALILERVEHSQTHASTAGLI